MASGDESYIDIHIPVASTNAGTNSMIGWVSPGLGETYQVAAVTARYDVGATGANASLQVEALGNGVTIGNGIAQLGTTISLNGATEVIQRGKVISAPTTLTDTSALSILLSGTLTNLFNVNVTISLRRLT